LFFGDELVGCEREGVENAAGGGRRGWRKGEWIIVDDQTEESK